MRIAFQLGEADLDLDVAIPGGDALVADVVTALADGPVRPEVGLLVDGTFVAPSWPVADAAIRDGSRIQLATGPATPAPTPLVEVGVVGGLSGGTRFTLAKGTHVIGRRDTNSVSLPAHTVSGRHAELEVGADGSVAVADLGSTNGTRVDGRFVTEPAPVRADQIVQLGAVQLSCGRPPTDDSAVVGRPGPHGLTAFNRPPRVLPPAAPAPVRLPSAPGEVRSASRFGWATLLAPVAVGIVLAVLWDPRMALFALFSPVMMLGNWIEDRRRVKRERKAGGKQYRTRLAETAAALAGAQAAERQRLLTLHPDPAEVRRRAEAPSNRLWERRSAHDDFLRLRVGVADVPWAPPVTERAYADRSAEVDALVADHSVLVQSPVVVDLGPGRCLGVVGDRAVALALLRSLVCQAAIHHGPADVRVAVLADGARADDWDWIKWLPHTRSFDETSGRRLLGATATDVDAVLAELLARPVDDQTRPEERPAGATTLLVIDADGLTEGRNAPARELLGGAGRPVAGIVLGPSADRLPAACTSVMTFDGPDGPDGTGRYREPAVGVDLAGVLVAGMAADAARACARALARLEDPEVPAAGGNLPDGVALLDLLGMDQPSPDDLLGRWRNVDTVPRVAAPIGATERGPLVLDLVADGPHGLVAGTTGSGKSELLRSLVASLAASIGPEHLNFVLVDYKGGSAFDACSELPHTVGLVTDLDEHLGRRALRCLEAELHYRERRLREAGASDLPEYLRAGNREPLPRLLVVMDEFAAIAAELPDFVDRLVDVAQRGRSLGVHLLLATQRPTGVVNDHIRANTNVRVALRVQDAGDSTDVIGTPAAASIGRSQAGRGFVRLGPGELVPFQAALSTGTTAGENTREIDVRPFTFGAEPPPRNSKGTDGGDQPQPSDLALLVAAARAAAVKGDIRAPRRPWLEPLTDRLLLDEVFEHHAGDERRRWAAPIGVVDEPDHQRQRAYWWEAAKGHLVLYGVGGSGTTTALSTLAVSLARTHRADQVHLYVLDFGTGALAPLAELPHVGAFVGAGERERQVRLIRQLRAELERRRRLVADTGELSAELPAIVLLLDNYGGFMAAFDDLPGTEVRDELNRVVADGAGLGMYVVLTADRINAVPTAVATLVSERLAFRLGDKYDYGVFGLPHKEVPKLGPGRCLHAETHLEIQIALPGPAGLADAVTRCRGAAGTTPQADCGPAPVGSLPKDVRVAEVAGAARVDGEDWVLPIGIGDDDLEPACFRLGPGDHALITGPARSGKSSALVAVAELAAASRPEARITAVAFRRSPLRDCGAVHRVVVDPVEIDDALTAVANDPAPQLLLIDDADLYEDDTRAITALLAVRRPDVHVVAGGRADALRTNYGHWTTEIRRSRQGFALRPEDMDTELWNVSLPRHRPVHLETGRGYLVANGHPELTQGARP